jgi:glycogen synthase
VRILLSSRVFPPAVGGMERFAEQVAGWLAARGHEVSVVTRTPGGPDADRDRPYRVLREPSTGAFLRAVRQADAVHVNGLSLRGILVATATGRSPVTTHQGHQAVCPTGLAWPGPTVCDAGPVWGPCRACPLATARGRADVAVHRIAVRLSRRNVTVSRYLERRLRLPRSAVVYNPVSQKRLRARTGGTEADGLIAFAGRLVAEKGLDLLLRSLARVPEARLEVAGDGPLRGGMEQLATALGVAERVRFLGSLPFEGVADLYARAAVVCVPTVCDEAFGYAAAEAMAMGRPVVATPRGALVELLEGKRGFLADRADPPALATALHHALSDSAVRRGAAERAAAFAERYLTIDVIGPRYESLYEEVAR